MGLHTINLLKFAEPKAITAVISSKFNFKKLTLRIMKKLLLATTLLFSLFANAQLADKPDAKKIDIDLAATKQPIEVLRLGQAAYNDKDYGAYLKAMEKLVSLNPLNPSFNYKLAEAYSLADKKTQAFNTLIKIQKQGMYFDIANNPNLENINKFPVFKYIKDNMDISAQHYGEGLEVFNIDKSFSGLLFESITYDGNDQAFLMGSIRDGSIIKISAKDGKITTLVPATEGGMSGPWAVQDIGVDENKDLMWVASSSVPRYGKFTKENLGMAGVFKYQLSTGKLLDSYLLPSNNKPHLITSLDLTHKGEVFFIETYKSSALKLNQKAKKIEVVFNAPKFANMKSLAVDEAGEKVFFNDFDQGLFVADVGTKKFYSLGNQETLNTIGISDVMYNNNTVYFIQSNTSPQRLMQLDLDKSKVAVAKVLPLEASHPKFDFPSFGLAIGDHIYYIANSQVPKTSPVGGLLKNKSWDNMYILRSDVNYQSKENAAFKKHIEEYREKTGSSK